MKQWVSTILYTCMILRMWNKILLRTVKTFYYICTDTVHLRFSELSSGAPIYVCVNVQCNYLKKKVGGERTDPSVWAIVLVKVLTAEIIFTV